MLHEVSIKKTDNPELGYTDENKLKEDIEQHRVDVCHVMDMISAHMTDIGVAHDWTKIAYFDKFAQDTLERLDTPEFKERDWYSIHTSLERHHVNAHVPEDVDLFDIIEMIVDCIVAGMARSTFNPEFLVLKDENVLEDAYWNTIEKLEDKIKLR